MQMLKVEVQVRDWPQLVVLSTPGSNTPPTQPLPLAIWNYNKPNAERDEKQTTKGIETRDAKSESGFDFDGDYETTS